jgi:hypothetical protein
MFILLINIILIVKTSFPLIVNGSYFLVKIHRESLKTLGMTKIDYRFKHAYFMSNHTILNEYLQLNLVTESF